MGWQHLLFYSAGTFVDERYAIGYALCEGSSGPCRRASDRPLLASGGDLVGPGGQAAFVDRDGSSGSSSTAGRTRGRHGNIRVLRLAWLVGPLHRLSVVRGPIGHIDSVTAVGRLVVKGWAIDPAAASAAVVRVGGVAQSVTLLAAAARPMSTPLIQGLDRRDSPRRCQPPGWVTASAWTPHTVASAVPPSRAGASARHHRVGGCRCGRPRSSGSSGEARNGSPSPWSAGLRCWRGCHAGAPRPRPDHRGPRVRDPRNRVPVGGGRPRARPGISPLDRPTRHVPSVRVTDAPPDDSDTTPMDRLRRVVSRSGPRLAGVLLAAYATTTPTATSGPSPLTTPSVSTRCRCSP